jgi:acyl-CoA dehydrogenase
MDILHYTEEHQIFRDSLRRYVKQEVVPHVDAWERDGIVPRRAWKAMGDQGFLCPMVPEAYGGQGADFLYSVIVAEELSRAGVTGLAATLHSDVVVPYLVAYGSEALKQRWLPGCVSGDVITAIAMTEPNTGSDLAAIRTTAVEAGDQVVLNGQKTFISNGSNCDLVIVAARDPAVEDPHGGIDLYVVEAGTPGFEKGRRIPKIGWHSQDTAELFFTDCRVPLDHRLGEKGTGFYHLMEKLQQERLMVCISAVASAEHVLELTIDYCRERQAFGRPLTRFQHTQFTLVELATEVKLGRTFVDKLVADHCEGLPVVVEVAMGKYWTAEMACRVADRCLQLHGGYGYCEEYPIARAWRDLRVLPLFAGTSEIMKLVAARFMGL